MARLARVVVPGVPHHVTQRGNRRQTTFFHEEDCAAYLTLLGERCGRHRHQRTGRPLGESVFLERVERTLGRVVRPAKRGRKAKRAEK
jgi:hypothetical protein